MVRKREKTSSGQRATIMSDIFARASNDSPNDIGAEQGSPAKQLNLPQRERGCAKGPNYGKEQLLKQLKTENAELRNKAVDLALQLQSLRDDETTWLASEDH